LANSAKNKLVNTEKRVDGTRTYHCQQLQFHDLHCFLLEVDWWRIEQNDPVPLWKTPALYQSKIQSGKKNQDNKLRRRKQIL
jgi:hypothetical protein